MSPTCLAAGLRAARRRGRCSRWWTAFEGGSLGTPNDLTFHPSGAIYFTAPKGHYAEDPPPGRVYRLGPGGDLRLAADVPWPNGVNVNADGSVLYVADSSTGEVLTHDIRADGTLANRAALADLREGQDNLWAVDGMCLDVEGNIYVAVYGSYRVRRVTPEGEIDLDIPVGHEKAGELLLWRAGERRAVHHLPRRRGVSGQDRDSRAAAVRPLRLTGGGALDAGPTAAGHA